MSSTRERAVVALDKIFNKGEKPKEALSELSWEGDKRERAFLMELVYGVLRYRDFLDWMLKDFLRKPSGLPFNTINNLRIAVYQIMYLRVPEWAAVNETVDVEKERGGKVALVNAVLRNFLRHGRETIVPDDDVLRVFGDPVTAISISASHPRWLIKRWLKRFGYEDTLRLARKNNEIPPLTIRIDDAAAMARARALFEEKGVRFHPTRYAPSGIVIETPHFINDLYDIVDFPWIVQDEAAQMITWLLAPRPGERVLDACAAPGGKSTHIAKLMQDKGQVIAVEAEPQRIGQLEQNISRLGVQSVTVVQGDVRELRLSGMNSGIHLFDRILLDAPCSALGVVRRNPDVKYRRRPQDLQQYKENQISLLQAVSLHLKAGGSMVYSVCSTEPEEGEEVVESFLHGNRNFSIIEGEHDFLRTFSYRYKTQTFYRTFPHEHGMDGFFAARLKKVE